MIVAITLGRGGWSTAGADAGSHHDSHAAGVAQSAASAYGHSADRLELDALAEMFQDIRKVTTLFNDVTPTVSKFWEGPGMPDTACSPLVCVDLRRGLTVTLRVRLALPG